MGVTEWVMLGAAVAAVLMIYLITRRNNGPNPWRDMDNETDELSGQPADDSENESADVLVDPSVAGEWEDFTPERQERLDEPAHDVDSINPASLRNEPVPEAQRKEPAEAMLGYVSEPRPVRRDPTPRKTTKTTREATTSKATARKTTREAPREAPRAEQPATQAENQKIVVLHVVAQDGEQMAGGDVHSALAQCNLQYGERDVYHRVADLGGQQSSIFSVANMLKPGTLKPEESAALRTKGLVMFMILPGPVDGNKAFHDMLNTAQGLAKQLNARVLDDKRLPLTRQAAQYQIDEIAELERRRRLAEA